MLGGFAFVGIVLGYLLIRSLGRAEDREVVERPKPPSVGGGSNPSSRDAGPESDPHEAGIANGRPGQAGPNGDSEKQGAESGGNLSGIHGHQDVSADSEETDRTETTADRDPEADGSEDAGTPEPAPPPVIPLAERLKSLEAAREKAIAECDVKTALDMVEQIAALEDGDLLRLKLQALRLLEEVASTPAAHKEIAEAGVPLLDEVITAKRQDVSENAVNVVLSAARKSGDLDLVRTVTVKILNLQ